MKRLDWLRASELVFVASTLCCSAPQNPWNESMSRAKKNARPFVVEFTAVWCKPCETFEREVLSRPDVKRELERVEFLRLDYDSELGRRHARRLGIDGIPTVALIGANGQLEGGLRGAASAERFLSFLEWVQTGRRSIPIRGP